MFVEISYFIGEKETVIIESLSKPRLIPRTRMTEGKKNNTSILEMSTHNGTHLDAPYHIDPNGLTIDAMNINDFIFEKPLLIECPKDDLEKITKKDLEPFSEKLKNIDFLMVFTGFSQYRHKDPKRYIYKSPGFSKDSAEYLVNNFNLRGVMVDCIGIENIPDGRETGFEIHKVFLGGGRRFIAVEDANLKTLLNKYVKRIFIIPLRVVGADASPVTAIAEI